MAEEENTAPALGEEPVASANCTGELVQLPALPGDTCTRYRCQVCGQSVMVGREDLEANGLPPEHALLVVG
jgi:hypothetical protein